MASITIDPGTVDHTLPDAFAGLGGATYGWGDFNNAAYRAAMRDLAPELLRMNYWEADIRLPSNPVDGRMAAFRDLCLNLGCAVIMGPTSAAPNAAPSTMAPNDPANVRADGIGASPGDQAAWLAQWHSDGLNIIGHEFCNEPSNCAGSHNPQGANPWYGVAGTTPSQADINKCFTWASVHLRQYATRIRQTGITGVKVNGPAIGGGQPFDFNWAKAFMAGSCIDGSAWPYGDGNWDYFDVLTNHPYTNGSTNQGRLNSIFYDPGDTPSPNASVGPYWWGRMFTEYVNAQGHPDKRWAWNESGPTPYNAAPNAWAGLVDVGQAIYAFGWQAAHKLDYFAQWSFNCDQYSGDTGEWAIMQAGGYALYTRACLMRDFAFYFSRNYKRIVGRGQAGGLTPSSGEQYGNDNAIPRLPWVAGLNADGSVLSVLVCNLDLSTDEALTIDLGSVVPTGPITGQHADQTTTVTGSTRCPSITPIAAASSFTQTIERGAMYRFDIPVSITGGGGGTPTFPAQPVVDDFNRANGDPGTSWLSIEGDTARPQIASDQLTAATG